MNRAIILLLSATALGACREKAERHVSETPAPPPPAASESVAPPAPPAVAHPARRPADTAYYPVVSSRWPSAPRASQLDSLLARDPNSAPLCAGTTTFPITADSIGPIRMGVPLSQVLRRCPHVLYGWYYISDGFAEPAIAVRLHTTLVRAFLTNPQDSGTVHRVEIGEGATTEEGLGVGSTLDALRRRYGAPGASESDCDLRVWFASRPGLSFRMAYPPAERRECGALTIEPLPADLRVVAVILVPR